jgi:hypothetical protein
MKILNKKGDEIYILCRPDESLRIGDCLNIGGIIAQVIDVEYASLPGILEHILRKSLLGGAETEEHVQQEAKTFLDTLSDHRLAITKIRGTYDGKEFRPGFTELSVDRSNAPISLMKPEEVSNMLGLKSKYMADIGETATWEPMNFQLMLDKLGINLITGMKGSGKSYAAKKILLKLIENGKVIIVFDLNGEYVNLWRDGEGKPGSFMRRVRVLNPKATKATAVEVPLRIPLNEVSYDEFASFTNTDPRSQMYNTLIVFWEQQRGPFDLDDLESWVNNTKNVPNNYVQTGLLGKIRMARALHLFGQFDMKSLIKQMEKTGGTLIVNLRGTTRKEREVIVEFIVRRLTDLRTKEEIKPIGLFAEEAQLYVTKAMWDDILTRMRHHGIFPTFITNDPRTLPDEVFSLCDNLISFKFENEDDLRQISKAKMIDLETLKLLRNVEFFQCLIIGSLTRGFPILITITPQKDVMMGGETQKLFD